MPKTVFSLLILLGCGTPDYLSEEALQQYVSDESNRLSKSKNVGNLNMQVTLRPSDLLVWQDVGVKEDTSDIKEAFGRYSKYLYLMMQLSVGERDALYALSKNQMEFNDRLQTLSFRMNQFANLTTSANDTLPVADFYYSRMFGLSSSNDVLFVFNVEEVKDIDWVSFNTKEFGFNSGRQSFRFDWGDIQEVPHLLPLKPFEDLR